MSKKRSTFRSRTTRADLLVSATAGGDISLLTKADGDQVQINVARTSEATRNANFRSLVHEIAVTYRGHQCLEAPDMASLGFAAGDQVTLQLTYLAGTGNTKLYQVSCRVAFGRPEQLLTRSNHSAPT